jgi:hypothetical protein
MPVIRSTKRNILVAGGARAGKSVTLSAKAYLKIMEEENELFWLLAADYARTRAEFDYLTDYFSHWAAVKSVTKRVDPGVIELENGCIIETKSANDPRTLAMKAPKGIIVCEASQIDLETFYRCLERLIEKRGWLLMGGTFEAGSLGWYPMQYKAWLSGLDDSQSFSLPTDSNTYLFPDGENDPELQRLKRESSDEFWLERIKGIPVPPQGRVFPEFRPDVHVRNVQWEPDYPVHLWVDPGYAGAYAVECVQVVDGQVRIFDEIYEKGLVTEDIATMVLNRPWWQSSEKFGVIDIGGTQHQAMPAAAEEWLKQTGITFSSRKVRIMEGVERLKTFLKVNPSTQLPWLAINPKCTGILSEFGAVPSPFDGQDRAYRWKMNREGGVAGESPEDRYNHGIKAITYGLVDHFGYVHSGNNKVFRMGRWR